MKSDLRLAWRTNNGGRHWLLGGLFAFVVLLCVVPLVKWREQVQAAQSKKREPVCLANQAKIIRRVPVNRGVNSAAGPAFNSAVGPTLRKFRIAMVATSNYVSSYGSGAGSLDAWLAGVNAIYEKEVGIRLERVGNNALLTAAANYPFSNSDPGAMVDQVRSFFKNNLSAGAYDLGIVLGTGSGGTAYIGVVCETAGDTMGLYKGGAAALVNGTPGNDTSVRLIAHEIGHQFSAMHTQNADCANRFGETAYEPGSGVTLMSNAGSCGNHNVTLTRSAQFHAGSFEQINQYLSSFVGTSNATPINTGNNTPTVDGGLDYTIPKGTPFSLTVTTSHDQDAADVPNLTYSWEQMDAGGDSFANDPEYGDQAGDPSTTTRPLFRTFVPVAPGGVTRTFPSLNYILEYMNAQPDVLNSLQTGERLPAVARTLNFRVTVRDGRGGVNNDAVQLTVDDSAGPFKVTLPNAPVTWQLNGSHNVQWDVLNTGAGTNVNCGLVNIMLSTNSGSTFTLLEGNVPNTGSAPVSLPSGLTDGKINTARIKVAAANNIFFDISDSDFTIDGCNPQINKADFSFAQGGGPGVVSVTAGQGCQWGVDNKLAWVSVAGGGNGNGSVSFTVAANTGGARSGSFTVAGHAVTITQDGCSYTLGSNEQTFPNTGGNGSVSVTTGAACSWTATSNAGWLSITAGGSGTGNGTVSFSVSLNPGATRSGTLSVAGQTVTITQPGCGYSLSSNGQTHPNIGGNFSVNVTAGAGCPWTATSNVGWLSISSGGSGTGNGTVNYTVAHTNEGDRTGTLSIAGQTFTVTQTGCAYSITPSARQSAPYTGVQAAAVSVSVNSGMSCSWTATVPDEQDQSWLHVNTSGGMGAGTVTYTADSNTSVARSGRVRIAGENLWVDQAGIVVHAKKCDFDGDGKTDLSVWRGPLSPAPWLAILSLTGVTQTIDWGTGQSPYFDLPVPGDYDGDGKTDQAIWRGQNSLWYIRKSTNGQPLTQLWGANYSPYFDVPVQGDYDGDGKTDFAVWRPTDGTFYVLKSSDGLNLIEQWGSNGDKPVPGDYDGDHKTDFAYWRPSNGTWYIKNSSGGTLTVAWGAGYAPYFDVPVQADYDGDGKTDLAIWRGQDSLWYIRKSSDTQPLIQLWGANYAPYNDVPTPGDYDGDGKADIAVWRPPTGTWYVLRSTNGSHLIQTHGQSGDTALPSLQW
jgi:hypothetical protein